MKVMVIPIGIGAPETIPESFVCGLEEFQIRGRAEAIRTTALLRSAIILKRDLENWACCHSDSSERSSTNYGVKNSQGLTKSKYLATLDEDNPKAPFSIATTQRCRRGRDSIPWIAPLYPGSVPYNAEC